MSRTEFYGVVALAEDQVDKAKEHPFLGLCFVDDDDNVEVRNQSLNEIGLVRSVYDGQQQLWEFQLDLHDDDWANADLKPLERFLEISLVDGRGFFVVRQDWKDVPDWLMTLQRGHALSVHIIDYEETDPRFVKLEQAAALVEAQGWKPAASLFERVKSRRADG